MKQLLTQLQSSATTDIFGDVPDEYEDAMLTLTNIFTKKATETEPTTYVTPRVENPPNTPQSPIVLTPRVEANQPMEDQPHVVEPIIPTTNLPITSHPMKTRSQSRQQPNVIPAYPHELAQSTIGPLPYKQMAVHNIIMNEFKMTAQANSIIHPDTGATLEYEQLIKDPLFQKEWLTSSANEFGRLTNGVGDRMPTGTNTMFFIKKSQVPAHKLVTYAKFVCDHRPQKEEVRSQKNKISCGRKFDQL
jgi:hypothetical protein